ncbi:ADP-heptose:LPS heptosyltransferase [Verrucomicrobium sp. GAS474]|uniref:glycosyltransferase family 9 protein n=1 Tax=Verrucomicrobium sp. GAS474 TaxID=1882831 RepID=UPI00087AB386|nr:glycosyltransferase family 9 protein [Verrucomicrobium sp. GAS474]SDT87724.1 ADP-heptose:LPS heptosyltransferase [Verrucomicrobium sp. GAS474]
MSGNRSSLLAPLRFAGRLLTRGFLEFKRSHLLRTLPQREAAARRTYFQNPDARASGILVLQPADIGDMVLTSVFLRRLREAFPTERIVVVASPLPARLLQACPLIDAVAVLDAKGIAGPDWITHLYGHPGWWEAAAALREAHFPAVPPALAISLRGERDALAAAAQIALASSRAKLRVGYNLKNLYGTLRSKHPLDLGLGLPPSGHETARQLALLAAATGTAHSAVSLPELWIAPAAQAEADALWATLRDPSTPAYAVLGIGAGKPEKKWPKEHFASLARRLQDEKGFGIAFIGGPEDRADAEAIAALGQLDSRKTIHLAGILPLEVTAAFLGNAAVALFVGNDSGPMHLASATAAAYPVLGLFGPQDLERWRPLSPRFHALQEPDLATLSVDRVFAATEALLR